MQEGRSRQSPSSPVPHPFICPTGNLGSRALQRVRGDRCSHGYSLPLLEQTHAVFYVIRSSLWPVWLASPDVETCPVQGKDICPKGWQPQDEDGDGRAVVEDLLSCLAHGRSSRGVLCWESSGRYGQIPAGKIRCHGVGLFEALVTSHARLLRDLPLWECPQSAICGPRKWGGLSPWGHMKPQFRLEPKASLTSISPQAVYPL